MTLDLSNVGADGYHPPGCRNEGGGAFGRKIGVMNDPNEECGRCEKRRFDHNYTDYCPIVDTWSNKDKFVPTGRFLKPPFVSADCNPTDGHTPECLARAASHETGRSCSKAPNPVGVPLCPGGCGKQREADGDLCRGCLRGANIVNRNAIKRLEDELRAVKILDAYSQTHRGAPSPHYDRERRMWFIEILSNGCCVRTVGRRSAAAARMLAADALVKEDPSLLEAI